MKKPSEWTPQEAWNESIQRHYRKWYGLDWRTESDKIVSLPFPSDPVERVSDDELAGWTEDGMMRPVRLMALELIERRKQDKEAKS